MSSGLIYNNEVLGDLVNRDTDGDGVLDWEESLWGTDPTKKETTPGIPDSDAIASLKKEQNISTTGDNINGGALTQTDKFSQELFATVAALNQAGAIDQTTVDKLSTSLADQIKNSVPKKVYLPSEIRVNPDNSTKAIQNYSDALNNIYKKNKPSQTVTDVLQKFIADGNEADPSVLPQLDPIIAQINTIINSLVRTEVPQSLASLHLDLINALERLAENVTDIKLYDTDTVLALRAISQYDQNIDLLDKAQSNLISAINKKLSN